MVIHLDGVKNMSSFKGMASTVHHPTLINLEILLRTDIASLGASFIGGTFGYLVGKSGSSSWRSEQW